MAEKSATRKDSNSSCKRRRTAELQQFSHSDLEKTNVRASFESSCSSIERTYTQERKCMGCVEW